MSDLKVGRVAVRVVIAAVIAAVVALPGGPGGVFQGRSASAAAARFTCGSWQSARKHVLAGEAIEAKLKGPADRTKATDQYRAALAACQDYPWAYSDLQQSYGDQRRYSESARFGWQSIETARRTKDRWAWSADEYRAFMAGCFDNLGWIEQVQAAGAGAQSKGYKTRLTTALGYYQKALFYSAHDEYARKHVTAIQAYLRVSKS